MVSEPHEKLIIFHNLNPIQASLSRGFNYMKCTSRDTHLFRPISFQSIHTHTQIPISSLNFQLFQQQIFPSIHPSTLKLAQLSRAVFFLFTPVSQTRKISLIFTPVTKTDPITVLLEQGDPRIRPRPGWPGLFSAFRWRKFTIIIQSLYLFELQYSIGEKTKERVQTGDYSSVIH